VFDAGRTTVGAAFHANAQASLDRIALSEGERTVTYAALEERSNRLANHLLARGLGFQDRVAILARNCVEYIEVEIAAAKAGLIVAALNWRLGDRELQHCIDLVEPSLIIESPRLSPNLERLELRDVQRLPIGDEYESALAESEATYPDLTFDSESGLIILYTSGTTGLPKGALISHRAMIARGWMFTSELSVPRDDHFVAWPPMFHMASTDQALAQLMRGGTVHVVDGYQPDQLVDLIERHSMRWLLLIPGMIDDFNEVLRQRKVEPKGLGLIGAMADLVPRQDIVDATVLLNAPFLNTFGATETGMCPASASAIPIGNAPERLPKRQTAFCDVRLVDPHDNEVPTGTPGEVAIAGPTLFSGYWNNDKVNIEDFRGGRFHMGDVMRRNPDGTLEYVDRVKYMIKSGGENIYPAEIEQVILDDERVETAVVVRKPHPRWGEVPVVFVVRRDSSLDDAALLDLCARELSSYKRPREIFFVDDTELPRSTTGKIQRHVLESRIG
jgi:fatty-acyl-CoA synthase